MRDGPAVAVTVEDMVGISYAGCMLMRERRVYA
jgi:hypothetical protein